MEALANVQDAPQQVNNLLRTCQLLTKNTSVFKPLVTQPNS